MGNDAGAASGVEVCAWDGQPELFTLLENYLVATEREKGNLIDAAEELPERYRIDRADPGAATRGGVPLVALMDGVPMGCVVLGVHGGIAEISRLWVEPGMRGTGAGRALMDAALELARAQGAHSVELTVWKWRAQARGLYASYGFREVASWDERADLMCMRLEFG